MTRGVKAGTKRGYYNRFSKPRLKKMAEHIRNGNFDRDAVAHVFEITGSFPNFLIAQAIRAGEAFNLNRLAIALEQLGNPAKPLKHVKALPFWMIKAALKYQKGLKLSSALGLGPDYHDDPKWRAYQRFMSAEFRKRSEPDTERKLTRSKRDIERELNKKWPQRVPGQFPKLEQAIRNNLRGDGIPLEVYRSQVRRKFRKQLELEILKKRVI